MSTEKPRILFAAPDECFIAALHAALPRQEHNFLAINALDLPPSDVLEYARTSSIEMIISRGGIAEFLREAQSPSGPLIPIISVQITPFDIIDAIHTAQKISRKIAFIAFAGMLEGIKKVTDIFDLDVRFVYRSSPWDCMKSIFTALEHHAEIIVGDARVVKMCQENSIPAVLLSTSTETLRHTYQHALSLIEAREQGQLETQRLLTVLDTLEYGILSLDGQGNVVHVNARACEYLKTDKEHILHKPAQSIRLLQSQLPPALGQDGPPRAVFSCGNKQEHKANWKKADTEICGIAGIISIYPGKDAINVHKGHTSRFTFEDIIGTSTALHRARARALRYAQADAVVLLQGQTGVGKELFAHAIHTAGSRKNDPFVAVNLAALPDTLMESELFGYVRGAFTDARRSGKQGVFEYADKGTVFLDEIGEMPFNMQSRLLRVLQDGEFTRLGDDKIVTARCRIIAATNSILEEAVRRGTFREDLYYRLNILKLTIPPLLERKGDIKELVCFFLKKFALKYNKKAGSISPKAMQLLCEKPWPGNIRELQALLECYVLLHDAPTVCIEEKILLEILGENTAQLPPLSRKHTKSHDDNEIKAALARNNYNIAKTAAEMNMHRTTLWRKLKQWNISAK